VAAAVTAAVGLAWAVSACASPARHPAAGTTVTGTTATGTTATGTTATGTVAVRSAPSVGPSPALLGSRPATLQAFRADDAHRPAAIEVPGYEGYSPIESRTTDPVSHGLDLPTNALTVAWWSSGAMPGDRTGTVVLAAHVSYNGSHGAFTHLDAMRPGEVIVLQRADGSKLRYRVTSYRHVVKSALDRQHLFQTDGPAQLAMITCGGSYDAATRNYRDNIIVFAAPLR